MFLYNGDSKMKSISELKIADRIVFNNQQYLVSAKSQNRIFFRKEFSLVNCLSFPLNDDIKLELVK